MTGSASSETLAQDLRTGLRKLAKAVVVITTVQMNKRYAMAATAVSELSFEPCSMLICVNRSASIYPVLAAGAPYAINILHHSHEGIARLCSGAVKGEERFATGHWNESAERVPRLCGAQASIVCRNVKHIEHGSHGVFIGDVVEVHLGEGVSPLVYVDGRYGRVSEPADG